MITVTFYAPSKFARNVQDLVKTYNGRFEHNPYLGLERTWFEISFEDDAMYNKFSRRINIFNQPWV